MNDLTYYCDSDRHLVCKPYSVENLHKMAEKLNIKKCWFHKDNNCHYDIPKERVDEIKDKCIVISSREIIHICKNKI